MIGRADIEGSKSDVAMNAWLPQASYPCGHPRFNGCAAPARVRAIGNRKIGKSEIGKSENGKRLRWLGSAGERRGPPAPPRTRASRFW
ncbi:hypothetical protein BSKO_05926 [Bryopsis sp. KO-2023]|nr:hypothetical protein BSKO_05926 [Bryopsis sp. KO-2023]